jgi:hypothetical protein
LRPAAAARRYGGGLRRGAARGVERPAEQEAPRVAAAQLGQPPGLLLDLDALGDRSELELGGHAQHGLGQRRLALGTAQSGHEGAVDLDLVEREAVRWQS